MDLQHLQGKQESVTAETTLTVVLGGDVPLEVFAQGMQLFWQLIEALTDDVGGEEISWFVDDLASGSAVATIRGEAQREESVAAVASAYAVVGRSLERGEQIPYSPKIIQAAHRFAGILNGRVTSIRFETNDNVSTVTKGLPRHQPAFVGAYGAIEGRISTLKSRGRKSFTLYDALDDVAVSCLLRSDQTDVVRDAWDKRVVVEGWIKRDSRTGRPVEVSPVENVTILPESEPGGFRRARGVLASALRGESPEAIIRRLRDA